jgi:hypothetical protein
MEACSRVNIEARKAALETGTVQVDAGDSDGRTAALHLACSNGHLAIASLVDRFEAKHSTRDPYNCSPQAVVILEQHPDVVRQAQSSRSRWRGCRKGVLKRDSTV